MILVTGATGANGTELTKLLSSRGTPMMWRVKPRFTYSAFLPVTGCVRITGCSALG